MKPDFAMASMGAGCFIMKDNKVLLVRVNYGPAKGQFILPGGMVEKDEHPHEACLRELTEETGLQGRVIEQITVRHRIDAKGRINIYWVFRCEMTSHNDSEFTFPQDEIQEVKFIDLEEALSSDEVRPNTRKFLEISAKSTQKNLIESYNEAHKDYIYT